MQAADRLSSVHEYYFSQKLKEVKKLVAEGRPIINLGIGNPDMMPATKVMEVLTSQAVKPDVHGYQPYHGTPELRHAIGDFYRDHYDLTLQINDEVLPLAGSKEGIMHISMAYVNPGDRVLVPEIGYPTYTSATLLAGGTPIYYPLRSEQGYEPDWSFFEALDWSEIKLIWINYPHMPTGSVAKMQWFERFIQLAQNHDCILVNDNPYSFLSEDKPNSHLTLPGAMECSVELNSLSKTFNMAGWRVGWAAGNKEVLQNMLKFKSNMDSGMFKPVQMAAIEALQSSEGWFDELRKIYRKRRELAQVLADKLELNYKKDQSGMFLWCHYGVDAEQLVDKLLYEKDIFIAPGKIFGDKGKEYVRISLCASEEIIEQAINRLV